MKAFIDSSTLFKKYVDEKGAEDFDRLLDKVTEIVVSPVTRLEINSVIERRFRDKTLTREQALWLRREIDRDFQYLSKIIFNQNLEEEGIKMIQKYQLKTLDSLQLASGCLANTDIFITSDKTLFLKAQKELKEVRLI